MQKTIVATSNAPSAIGPYSQAVRAGSTVYLSGQIPLDPASGELVPGGVAEQADQAFRNLSAVAEAAGGALSDCTKLTLFLTDLSQFSVVNEVMMRHFAEPYPARSTIEVSALPKGAQFEVDAIMVLP